MRKPMPAPTSNPQHEIMIQRGVIRDLEKQISELHVKDQRQCDKIREYSERIGRLVNDQQMARERTNELKRIIADNERQIADLTGYSRAQQERIEADSPIIEIPNLPTLATREQVRRNDELNRASGRPYRETDHYGAVSTGREPKKHWTEI
jgi:hypothetical protein